MSKAMRVGFIGLFAFACGSAAADPVADFYRGKQIRVIVRTLPATDYDAYSRLIARFMGKYIPGNPSMIVVNMTGGGGIIAANYMANVAPARRHRDRDREPGPRRRSGARHVAAAQGQSARVRLDRQCDLLEPAAGHLAHLADQDARGCKAARDRHRHHRRGLGVGAVSVVLQQRHRHQVQDHLRLPQRRRDRSRHGARGGRRTRDQSLFFLHGVATDLDPAEQDHSVGPGRPGEGA